MEQEKNKRILKRIDREILDRILVVLYEYGKNKRTIIARHADMGYDNCVMYLNYLEMLELIKKENNEVHKEIFGLTDYGMRICKKILDAEFENKQKQNSFTSEKILI